jgi:hypothetical protein
MKDAFADIDVLSVARACAFADENRGKVGSTFWRASLSEDLMA